jgi:hypothetical protein
LCAAHLQSGRVHFSGAKDRTLAAGYQVQVRGIDSQSRRRFSHTHTTTKHNSNTDITLLRSPPIPPKH